MWAASSISGIVTFEITHLWHTSSTHFVPCSDEHNEWYNRGGLYESYTGTVKKVDYSCLVIDDKVIALDDIAEIDTGADTMIQNAI